MTITLHQVKNRLAAELDDTLVHALAEALQDQMEDGYRIVFPCFLDQGRVMLCIALLLPISDRRLKVFPNVHPSSEATHVFLLDAFMSETEWKRKATRIIRIFPEQPNKPELLIHQSLD